MRGKKWFILLLSLALVLLASSTGVTSSSLFDLESSTGNTFQAWASRQWLQTTQTDFNAGVLNNVDISSSPGDVMLAEQGGQSIIASDDFESGGWNGGTGWLWGWWHEGDSSVTTFGTPHGGSYHLRLSRSTGYADRALDLSGQSNVHLQFWAKADSFEFGDFAECYIYDGIVWDTVETWVDGEDDNIYHFYDIDLSGYNMYNQFYICFDAEMGFGDFLYIDDLEVVTAGAGGYYSSGTLASQVLDTGINGDRWDALFWDETLPSGSSGTETLRPNASGTYTQCAGFGDSPNYRCVDDVTPDEDTTYVWPGVGGLRRDTYATEDSGVGTGTINSVTLYFRARLAGSCPTHTASTQLLTHGTLYPGANVTLTGSYADYSTVYTTNPNTGSAWTWTEVNDMEIGIGITGCSPGNEPFVTQVWAVVDYSGGAPSTNITFEVRAADTLSGGFPDASWVPVGGTSPVLSGLPSGRYLQWRAILTTSDPSQTPILHEVRVYHY
jgi:hypothetical protein